MKRLFKAMVMTGFFSLFLLFLASPSQSYYGGPYQAYPYYGGSSSAYSPPYGNGPQYIGSSASYSSYGGSSSAYSAYSPPYGNGPQYIGSSASYLSSSYGYPPASSYQPTSSTGYVPVSTESYPPNPSYATSYGSYPYQSYPSYGGTYQAYPSYPYSYSSPSNYSQSPINVNLNMNGSPSTNYPLPPININLNMNGSPYYSQQAPNYGGYGGVVAGTPYTRYPLSNYVAQPTPLPVTPLLGGYPGPAPVLPSTRFCFIHSTSDGGYVYLVFRELEGDEVKDGLAIFEISESGDCEYISHVTLDEGLSIGGLDQPILLHDDLAIIGAMNKAGVYLVDISDKGNPKLVNTLSLGEEPQEDGTSSVVTSLAVEDHVLFMSVGLFEDDDEKTVIYALDISDPVNTDEEDDLLDSYTVDDFASSYGNGTMVSTPDYLYIPGQGDGGIVLLVMDISDPENLSLVNTFDELSDSTGDQPYISIVGEGNYIYALVNTSERRDMELFGNGSFEFKIIDIGSAPGNPEVIGSSDELDGFIYGYHKGKSIVIKNNYAYVAANSPGAKIYVFDLSDPEDPIETSKSVDGSVQDLFLAGNNLCLHTNQIMKVFDISDPEGLSILETIDFDDILGNVDELDDWGDDPSPYIQSLMEGNSSSAYIGYYPTTGSLYGGYGGWYGDGYGLASISYGKTYGYGSSPYFNPNTGGYYGYGFYGNPYSN